jgi:uncharacterized protein YggT (Ycf19 family)
MKVINYILNGFGYEDTVDFKLALFGVFFSKKTLTWIILSTTAGTFRMILNDFTGLDYSVFLAFVVLICAEFQSGVMVSLNRKKERFKSRKLGRMILKVGTYVMILSVLNAFAKGVDSPDIFNINLNPFVWLYYIVFAAIVIQLTISWFENLGSLGYDETRTIAGFILRKFNKFFEFDGTKDNGDK